MINVTVKLSSEIRHHGAREVKSQHSDTAAVARFKKNFLNDTKVVTATTSNKDDSSSNIAKERKLLPLDHSPKAYGSHNGQKHAAILGNFQFASYDTIERELTKTNAVMGHLESLTSADIKSLKEGYRQKRDVLTRKLLQTHGPSVDRVGMMAYQNECARESFSYVVSQITMLVWSEDKFPGSSYDERRKLYTAAYPCKCVYTLELLPIGLIKDLESVMSGKTIPDISGRTQQQRTGIIVESSKGLTKVSFDRQQGSWGVKVNPRTSVDPESWKTIS